MCLGLSCALCMLFVMRVHWLYEAVVRHLSFCSLNLSVTSGKLMLTGNGLWEFWHDSVVLPEERETLCMVHPKLQGRNFPFAFPKSVSEQGMVLFLFFFSLIFLSVIIYANNPLAHSLQADLSLIFSRD